jgi:hypothetical protein
VVHSFIFLLTEVNLYFIKYVFYVDGLQDWGGKQQSLPR